MAKIKAGLIGCGRIGYAFDLDEKRTGTWTHAGAYNKCHKTEFVGVYDPYGPDLECANKYNAKVFSDLENMVEELDLISVAVPEDNHTDILGDLLNVFENAKNTPKILWVEKPFTGSFSLARMYVDTFAKYNCHIHVNYQRRFCSGFNLLKQKDNPVHIDIAYTRGLYNTASHFVDFIIGLYGMPESTIIVKDNSDFVMDYNDFRVVFSMLENINYNICDTSVYFKNEIIKLPPIQSEVFISKVIESKLYSEYKDLDNPIVKEFTYDPMVIQAKVLSEAIETGRYHKLNNGLQTLEILERVSNVK